MQINTFGRYRMRGTGAKAGGTDYLLQFMTPINVTENISRNGFAPKAKVAKKKAAKKKKTS